MTVELEATEIVTEPCLLAFPSLFEPRPVSKTKPDVLKWQATILIPAEMDLSPFYACVKAAMVDKFGKVIKLPARSNPLKSCEEKGELQGYEDGRHYINTLSGFQPAVVDQRRQEIIDPERIFGGCWCRFHIKAYAWDHPEGGKGISFSLEAVQLVREGERFGNRRAVNDVFDAIDTGDVDVAGAADVNDADALFG